MKESVSDRIVDKPTREHKLPVTPVGRIKKTDTTPSVQDVKVWKTQNTGAITITDFRDGQEGQPLFIVGEGFTTVANNANIKTSTGAGKLLAANRAYLFVHVGGVWYEVGP